MPADRRTAALIILATACLALGFAAYTQHAWEDYYITFRSSKNLVLGHGLVFTPGEKVHSFTSPLGVLLPALCSILTGTHADGAALWLFRAMGALALGGAASLLYLTARRLGAGHLAAGLTAGFLALEAKVIDFSTNGMETGFLLLFLAYAIWALAAPSPGQYRHLGAAWAGIMWTRPDGFIYIGLLGASWWVFNHFAAERQDRLGAFRLLVKAAIVCTVLYLPWFVWAWLYYGSPVPHTILAKGSLNPGRTLGGFLGTFALLPFKLWTGQTTVDGTLMPTYYQAVAWPAVLTWTARALGAVAMLAWCWPRLSPATRAASFAFHGAHAYLTYFPYFPFPWYFPATGLLGAVVWGGVAGHMLAWARAPQRSVLRAALVAVCAVILLAESVLTVVAARQMKAKQELAYGNLRRIGEWLREHARPDDHVFLEPLGYIGYFSQLRAYDFPGLSSPRMVEARRGGNGWARLLLTLEPEWVVLRDPEIARVREEAVDVLGTLYEPVREFDVRPQVESARVLDPFMLRFDAHFTVYRRTLPARREHLILGIQHFFGTEAPMTTLDRTPVHIVHAPGTMSIRVPDGAARAEIPYGFVRDAHGGQEQTDGATFHVYWADGSEVKELARRTLDPANQPGDRGIQSFNVELPAGRSGRARLLLHTKAGRTMTRDWTCWSVPAFE